VYDYLSISRYKALGKTGLHDSRLSPNYMLGVELMRNDGDELEGFVAYTLQTLFTAAVLMGPFFYIGYHAIINLYVGISNWDVINCVVSIISIFLLPMGQLVIKLSGRLEFPKG
jgi:hypothetical protein